MYATGAKCENMRAFNSPLGLTSVVMAAIQTLHLTLQHLVEPYLGLAPGGFEKHKFVDGTVLMTISDMRQRKVVAILEVKNRKN